MYVILEVLFVYAAFWECQLKAAQAGIAIRAELAGLVATIATTGHANAWPAPIGGEERERDREEE